MTQEIKEIIDLMGPRETVVLIASSKEKNKFCLWGKPFDAIGGERKLSNYVTGASIFTEVDRVFSLSKI